MMYREAIPLIYIYRLVLSYECETIPRPQAARYNNAGEPSPPAPMTNTDDFKRFDCAKKSYRQIKQIEKDKYQSKEANQRYRTNANMQRVHNTDLS